MKKLLKWIGIGLGSLLGLVIIAGLALFLLGRSRLNRTYTLETQMVTIPADEAALARGQHLVTAVVGCVDCHGPNLGGEVFIDAPPIGRVVASNLTTGAGGIGSQYGPED